ncbi:MAG: 3-dehydroquinate synthase [Deltaproteobacteria bacterium]|nr:MAG: 3-dehydroquinate synthase [Deltaproteobacteria bacterium]
MVELKVGLGERSYPIVIGAGLVADAGRRLEQLGFARRLAVISNPTVADLYADTLLQGLQRAGFDPVLLTVPDGEEYKTLDSYQVLMTRLIEAGFDRSSGLIALGGGVVGDLTGFVAATYLRGIPFVQVPTSLLAQVDSSVGGKTGVNHPLGKNLIGAFYQPRAVLIDVTTLKTLPEREFHAGLAEVVKYGVIRDRDFFIWLDQQREKILALHPETLVRLVEISCQTKADIVENDEKEKGLRAILNFGHTYGHVVETLSGYGKVRHGEAVAIGMVVAARISRTLGHCRGADVTALQSLLQRFSLPVQTPAFDPDEVMAAMYRDKKVQDGRLRFVLNRGIGDCLIEPVDHPRELLAAALTT